MIIDINTDSTVIFTNKLEKMKRSALPNAVRSSLNSAAFDVKQNTMPQSAKDTFVERKKNFFKANSRVEVAKGWNVRTMQSIVGFKSKGGKDKSVDELEHQEHGGKITSRSFVPLDTARTGGNNRPVRPGNRLSSVKKLTNSNTIAGKTPKQQFKNAVNKAGVGGFVIGNKAKKIVFRVESIGKKDKLKPVYSYEKGRDVGIKATGFMEQASVISGKKIENFYIAEAKKQIDRLK